MKFTPVEWSPHICTQPTKESNDTIEKSDDAEVVSVESSSTSSPIRRRDSLGSFSNSSSIKSSEDSFLDDPSICFQALSLDPSEESVLPSVVEAVPSKMSPTKRRVVKAIRISREQPPRQQPQTPPPPQDVSPLSISSYNGEDEDTSTSLEARKKPCFTTTERITEPPSVFPGTPSSAYSLGSPSLQVQVSANLARPTLARSKRQRAGSDLAMADAVASCAQSDSRSKKRRLKCNRAMTAQEFDSVLSQIDIPGSL
ncbi:hypothetical protein IV203_002743 [Nitzschia inconspicua]|uniref:Uncharacterized protein n=1 Tax=Nitzschia inconspicua TaxID=303405 RepID=A0A9K3L200_9STRA|nr:hypothetical protein IV203_002743 [Nitzschia inconspicua]